MLLIAKSQYFQDFSVSFWYNKGIKKGGIVL